MKPRSRRYICLLAILGLFSTQFCKAQSAENSSAGYRAIDPGFNIATVPLWDGAAPGSIGNADADIPTITIFPPQPGKGNGTAIVVAPGGAYLGLASNLEGRQVADWFAAHGVTAFVLKYRLGPKYIYPIPLIDAQRAIRIVRSLGEKYHFAQTRVGMCGFSAGGHLTAMAGTLYDNGRPDAKDPIERLSSRPDFLVLAYPWINAMQPSKPNMIPPYQALMQLPKEVHQGLEARYTPTLLVTAQTPPAFIFSTSDDNVVPVEASIDFYSALRKAGVPAELHVFRHGAHGVGLGSADVALDIWPTLLVQWMRDQGWLAPEPGMASAANPAVGPKAIGKDPIATPR